MGQTPQGTQSVLAFRRLMPSFQPIQQFRCVIGLPTSPRHRSIVRSRFVPCTDLRCSTPKDPPMEVAITAIALITFFCGRSICCEPQTKLKLKPNQAKELGSMVNEYMEYVMLEEKLEKEQLRKLKQLRYR